MNAISTAWGSRASVDRVVRRYEPLLVAVAAALLVIQLVAPIHLAPIGVAGLSPFVDTGVAGGTKAPATVVVNAPQPGSSLPEAAPASPAGAGYAAPSPISDDTTASASSDPDEATVFAKHAAPGGAGGVAAGGPVVFATLASGAIAQYDERGSVRRTILIPGATRLTGLAIANARTLYVLDGGAARVLAVDTETGAVETIATIPDVAPCIPVVRPTNCDGSPVDRPADPTALAFDAHGRLFVADSGQGAIWAVPANGGAPRQWMVDSALVQPDKPFGPGGLAVDGTGRLIYAVPTTGPDDAGAIYAQKIADDGGPGARTTLATLAAGAHPTGVVVSASGKVYVSLAGVSQIAVFGPDGAALRQIPVDRTLQAGLLQGLTFDGKDLLVAGTPPTPDASSAIVRIPVGEPGAPVYGRSTT